VLLTALAVAAQRHLRRRGAGSGGAILVDVERHGREEIVPGTDLSLTVGWFTSFHPVRLDPGPCDLEDAMAGGPALGRALKLIKEQLLAVPDNGIGYGILRYLNAETAEQLALLPRSQIGFNYLGRFQAPTAGDSAGALEDVALGSGGDAAMPLAYPLNVDALTLDDPEGVTLKATWSWAPALIGEDQVRALAQDWFAVLEAMVRHTAQPEAGGRTPSDLPLVSLSQAEIEQLERLYAN
jgi:non-ribosomal peptide synthase protein (TIGR01720 family)